MNSYVWATTEPPTGLWEDKCNEGLLNFPPESHYYYWIHSDQREGKRGEEEEADRSLRHDDEFNSRYKR